MTERRLPVSIVRNAVARLMDAIDGLEAGDYAFVYRLLEDLVLDLQAELDRAGRDGSGQAA